MYLFDDEILKFFKKAHKHLVKNRKDLTKTGLIFVKENITKKEKSFIHSEDNSVTRPLIIYQKIFKEAGFKILSE
jgi:hypothetical protein